MPTTTTVTTRGVMWLILKEVMRLHGIPESIVSDQDTKFTSIFWKELHRLMGSNVRFFTLLISHKSPRELEPDVLSMAFSK